MGHDENVYPDPNKFDPERFMGENQQLDPMKFSFGFSRRICPGMSSLYSPLTTFGVNK
jgi:cytochrome P450